MPGTTHLPERLLIASAVVLTCILFTREALDPVNVIKLTALLLVAVALVAVVASRAVRTRMITVPVSPAGVVAVVLGIAFVVSAATAPVTTTAVVGAYGRNSGLLAYAAALVLFVVGLRVFTDGRARTLVGGVVFAGLFTSTYGLLQLAGVDAIPWNNPFNPIIAALGNPNFASGYMGVAACVGLGGALDRGWALGWRALSGLTAALCLLGAVLSNSDQGPIAAAAGLFVVAVAFSLNLESSRRVGALTALALVAVVGAGAFLAGALAGAGPAARVFGDVGTQARTYYWDAALQMFRDAPLLGVGLDHYGAFWRSARSVESARALGGSQFSDSAHSVPLQMLAQGGLLLGLAYLTFVGVVLFALVRGLLRLRGPERMLLGAVGGGWTAYLLSSSVSIDQVPLVVLNFALAGGVVAAARASGLREVTLPGALKPVTYSRSDAKTRKRLSAAPRQRAMDGSDLALLGVLAVAGVSAAWFSLVPLRANTAALNGDQARAAGDGTSALAAYDRATDLLDGQAFYWIKKGQLFQQAPPPLRSQSADAFLAATERDPYDVNAMREAAALAEQDGELDLSRSLHQRAVRLDPLNPDTIVAAATFELRHSGAREAQDLLEKAVLQLPNSATMWATLGDARLVLSDDAGAAKAYDRALGLNPAEEVALEGLEKLRTA